jgi:hypothetical protein
MLKYMELLEFKSNSGIILLGVYQLNILFN